MLFCGRVEQSEPKIRNENPREHPTRRHLPPKQTWIDPRPPETTAAATDQNDNQRKQQETNTHKSPRCEPSPRT